MKSLKEIAKTIKDAYDKGIYDPDVEKTLEDTLNYINEEMAREEAEMRIELEEDFYVDPSELIGFAGHYADETMYEEYDEIPNEALPTSCGIHYANEDMYYGRNTRNCHQWIWR